MIALIQENLDKLTIRCQPCLPLYSEKRCPKTNLGAYGLYGVGRGPFSKNDLPSSVQFSIEFNQIDDDLYEKFLNVLTQYDGEDISVWKTTVQTKSQIIKEYKETVEKYNAAYTNLTNIVANYISEVENLGAVVESFHQPKQPDLSKYYENIDVKVPQKIKIGCYDETQCYKDLNGAGLLSRFFNPVDA